MKRRNNLILSLIILFTCFIPRIVYPVAPLIDRDYIQRSSVDRLLRYFNSLKAGGHTIQGVPDKSFKEQLQQMYMSPNTESITKLKQWVEAPAGKIEKIKGKEIDLTIDPMTNILLDNFKKYITTNDRSHSGNLYEHSIWSVNAIGKFWQEKEIWVEGLSERDIFLSKLSALLHDIGKAGDLEKDKNGIYKYDIKSDHPQRGYEYLLGIREFWLDEVNTFDFQEYFDTLGLSEEEKKIITILTGIHWEFGAILKNINKGMPKQEAFTIYLTLLKDLAFYADYKNGEVDELLLKMGILAGASDVLGARPVEYTGPIIHFPTLLPPHPSKIIPYEKYEYDTTGKQKRNELLAYFKDKFKPKPAKPIIPIPAYKPGEPRTQTEALLGFKAIQIAINELFGDIVRKNRDIIQAMIKKEKELFDTHYVFYHGASKRNMVLYDVLKEVYRLFYPLTTMLEEFEALRLPRGVLFDKYETVDDFIGHQIITYSEIHDSPGKKYHDLKKRLHRKKELIRKKKTVKLRESELKELAEAVDWEVPSVLLSVNLSLFGNVDRKTKSECTFNYFAKDKERLGGTKDLYKKVLKRLTETKPDFPLDQWVEQFWALNKFLGDAKEGSIYQIFIPKNLVGKYVYFARSYGAPYGSQEATTYLFNRNIPREKRLFAFWALLERDPEAALGDPMKKVSDILEAYRKNPEQTPDINRLQARILVTNEGMINPSSNIKTFKYTTVDPAEMNTYKRKLSEVSQQFFQAWLNYTASK